MNYQTAKAHYAAIGKTSRSNISLFHNLAIAKDASFGGAKHQSVVLGEDGYIIVTSRAVGQRLVEAGYQYA